MNNYCKILLFILIFICEITYSQSVNFESCININNNFIDKKLLEDISTIGFMDENFKNNISNNLKNKNRFTTELNLKTNFYINSSYSITIESKNYAIGKISKDIINLGLFGNTPYLGENLNFNEDYILVNRYSKIGITNLIYNTKNEYIHINPHVIFGHQFFEYNIEKGEMTTSENGDFIDYTLKAQSHFANIDRFNDLNINGIGFGIDLNYKKKIKENEFNLIVEDLGIINWTKNSQNYTVDTICHFQGIVIEDIFHFNDSILENSINNLNSHYNDNQNKYSLRLPVKIKASFTRNLKNTNIDFIKLNMKHQPIIYKTPELSGSLGVKSKNNSLALGMKYGITEKVSFMIDINIKSEKLSLNIKTENLEYIINPNNSYGLNLLLAMKINLK